MSFDFKKHLITVQGGKEYLPVAARLMWVRAEHPEWGIKTTPIDINIGEKYAIFHAEIFNEQGVLIASGTKAETVKGFVDFIEKAETGSIGRALAVAGFGTQFALDELDEGERLADAPQQSPQTPAKPPVRATSGQSNANSGLSQKLIILEGFVKYGIPKDANGHNARGYVYNQVAAKLRGKVVDLAGYNETTDAERNIIETELKNPKPKFKELLNKAVTFVDKPTAEKSSGIAEPASYPIENHVFVDPFEEKKPNTKTNHGSH
jgi:hypothetical protein